MRRVVFEFLPRLMYYPYMASIVGKKRGTATYYYLVESARVDGRPRIVSQEYLGTAEELAAAMRGGGPPPGRAAAVHGDVPGAGGTEPAGRAVFEGRVRGLVEDHRRGPVHQDPRSGAGPPPVLGRDARRHPGATGEDQPDDRGADRAVLWRGRLLGCAGHDQFRHLH